MNIHRIHEIGIVKQTKNTVDGSEIQLTVSDTNKNQQKKTCDSPWSQILKTNTKNTEKNTRFLPQHQLLPQPPCFSHSLYWLLIHSCEGLHFGFLRLGLSLHVVGSVQPRSV